MDNLPSSPGMDTPSELQAQVSQLRLIVVITLFFGCMVSFSLDLVLFKQLSYAQKDVKALQPQVNALVSEYTKVSEPAIKEFSRKLLEYAKTHPEVQPILAKYNIRQETVPAMPAPASPAAVPGTPAQR